MNRVSCIRGWVSVSKLLFVEGDLESKELCVCVCGVAEYPVTTIERRGAMVPLVCIAQRRPHHWIVKSVQDAGLTYLP